MYANTVQPEHKNGDCVELSPGMWIRLMPNNRLAVVEQWDDGKFHKATLSSWRVRKLQKLVKSARVSREPASHVYVGKDVELIPLSKIAEQWAKKYARRKDGKYVVRLLCWEAERMIVQGMYRKLLSVDPYVTRKNDAVWKPLEDKHA